MTVERTEPLPLRTILVGGPGRSGTSFVADRLCRLPEVAGLHDIELKLLTEKNGLLDLWQALGPHYSPNRAVVAARQFRGVADALIMGRYGQAPLTTIAKAAVWEDAFARFDAKLRTDGHPVPMTPGAFRTAARGLIADLQRASIRTGAGDRKTHFLEKTPHALLSAPFLTWLIPDATLIHVMRDPRSIAWSLMKMTWGPDDLAGCATWVASYCRTWRGSLGSEIAASLLIEDIADDPDTADRRIRDHAGLPEGPSIFAGADQATLNDWANIAHESQIAFLTGRLGEWLDWWGYDAGTIGKRIGAPAPERQADTAEAATG